MGDLILKLVCIPSEDNPGDAPSRGVVQRWRRRPTAIPAKARRGQPLGVVHKTKQTRRIIATPGERAQAHRTAQFQTAVEDADAKIYGLIHTGPQEVREAWRAAWGDFYVGDGASISRAFSA